MTAEEKDKSRSAPEQEPEAAAPPAEEIPEQEPDHPGWLSLREILKKDHPVFTDSLFLIGYHFSSNMYLFGGDYWTLVDTGNDYTGITTLFDRGFKPADIKKIIITHGHRDHCMGTFELLRYPSVMEKKEVEILVHAAGPEEFKRLVREAGFPLTELKGGEHVDISGFSWEVIHTPGHTIDGISLYHAATKTLVSGDVVLPHAMADMDKNAGGRLDHYLYALRTLMKQDIETVLPGHGVPVAVDGRTAVEQTYEGLMLKLLNIEGRVRWTDGATMLAQKGFLEEAVFCCDKALALDGSDMTALRLKAFCLTDMNRCQEALDCLEKILARSPEDPHALMGKGQALMGMGRYEDAVPCFDAALGVRSDLREAQVLKGMALYLNGRYDEAMDIEPFREEFASRFKQEVASRSKSADPSSGGS